jgi:hypothetical protein
MIQYNYNVFIIFQTVMYLSVDAKRSLDRLFKYSVFAEQHSHLTCRRPVPPKRPVICREKHVHVYNARHNDRDARLSLLGR